MKRWFICPDRERIEIDDCLWACRLSHRCATKAFLTAVKFDDRVWGGEASVSQLDGTGERVFWLKDREDYAVEPQMRAFALLGTGVHRAVEDAGEDTEHHFKWEGLHGTLDVVEEEDGENILTDYKVAGSYAVMRVLGIKKVGERQISDNYGNLVLYQRGPKKGRPKTEPIYGADPSAADITDYQWQPNCYRVMINDSGVLKTPVTRMRIMFIVRDGGLKDARIRGVVRNTYMCPVPMIDDDEVRKFMRKRRDEIVEAMAQDIVPPLCTKDQAWGGNRCRRFCEVRDLCAKIGDNPWLKGYDDEE